MKSGLAYLVTIMQERGRGAGLYFALCNRGDVTLIASIKCYNFIK